MSGSKNHARRYTHLTRVPPVGVQLKPTTHQLGKILSDLSSGQLSSVSWCKVVGARYFWRQMSTPKPPGWEAGGCCCCAQSSLCLTCQWRISLLNLDVWSRGTVVCRESLLREKLFSICMEATACERSQEISQVYSAPSAPATLAHPSLPLSSYNTITLYRSLQHISPCFSHSFVSIFSSPYIYTNTYTHIHHSLFLSMYPSLSFSLPLPSSYSHWHDSALKQPCSAWWLRVLLRNTNRMVTAKNRTVQY